MPIKMEPTVCVGVDGSEAALIAVRWAANEAALRRWSLEIVHIRETDHEKWLEPDSADPALTRGMKVLKAARRAAADSNVEIQSEVIHGAIGPTLVYLSESADLIVVGSTSYFHELLAGSTAAFIAGHSRCPVVIVKGYGDQSGPVVLATDDPSQDRLVRAAVSEAQLRGVELVVVHSRSSQLAMAGGLGHHTRSRPSSEKPENLIDRLRIRHPAVRFREIAGDSTDVLHDVSLGASLLVMGRDSVLFARAEGSVTKSMIHRAACPLLIVP